MRRETARTTEQAEGRDCPEHIVGHHCRRVTNLLLVDHVRTGGDIPQALLRPRGRHGHRFEQTRGLQHDLDLGGRLGDSLSLFRKAASPHHQLRAARDSASQLEATVGAGHRMLLHAGCRLDGDRRTRHHQACRVAYNPLHGPLTEGGHRKRKAENEDENFLHSAGILTLPRAGLPSRSFATPVT